MRGSRVLSNPVTYALYSETADKSKDQEVNIMHNSLCIHKICSYICSHVVIEKLLRQLKAQGESINEQRVLIQLLICY